MNQATPLSSSHPSPVTPEALIPDLSVLYPQLAELESLISKDDSVTQLLEKIHQLSLSYHHAANVTYTVAPILPINDTVQTILAPPGPESQDPVTFKKTVSDLANDIINQTRAIVDEVAKLPNEPMTLESFTPIHEQLKRDSTEVSTRLSNSIKTAESLLSAIRTTRRRIMDMELERARDRAKKELEREQLATYTALNFQTDLITTSNFSDDG